MQLNLAGLKALKFPAWNKGLVGFQKGRFVSDVTKEKLSIALKGKPKSIVHCKSLSESHKGKTLTDEHKAKVGISVRATLSNPLMREKWSLVQKKRYESPDERKKTGIASMGHKLSDEAKNKIRIARQGKPKMENRGEKSHLWKGGITPINKAIRCSLEYRTWIFSVMSRDNWTCLKCGKRGGLLNAHHVKPFSKFPELRFNIDNGETLCRPCHVEIHKITDKHTQGKLSALLQQVIAEMNPSQPQGAPLPQVGVL